MNDNYLRFCMDFVLPLVVVVGCVVLLMTGRDGEVKAILAMAAGWLFKSGYSRAKPSKQ